MNSTNHLPPVAHPASLTLDLMLPVPSSAFWLTPLSERRGVKRLFHELLEYSALLVLFAKLQLEIGIFVPSVRSLDLDFAKQLLLVGLNKAAFHQLEER